MVPESGLVFLLTLQYMDGQCTMAMRRRAAWVRLEVIYEEASLQALLLRSYLHLQSKMGVSWRGRERLVVKAD